MRGQGRRLKLAVPSSNLSKSYGRLNLSEAAACDGILYRVGPKDDNTNPGPGTLPI